MDTGIGIEEHYLARRLPRGGTEPAVFEDPVHFSDLIRHEHTPTRIEDWLYTDKPPLSVHVVTFTNATVLGLSFSHTFLDAVSRSALLKAWTAVLNDREDDVPPYQGFAEDPLEKLNGRTPPGKYLLHDTIMGSFGFLVFVVCMIFEFLFYPKQECRVVFLPGPCVKALRDQALQDLATESTTSDEKPFVSEGDVLFAWWAKTTIKALRLSSSRPINLMNVMNFRGVVDDVLPPDQAFIGNATTTSQTHLTAGEIARQPVGKTALRIRNSLLQQRTQEQAEAYVALHHGEMEKTGRAPLFGPPTQMMLAWSNWHKARFFDVDFSAAVLRSGLPLGQRANKLGRPSYIGCTGHENGFLVRNAGPVLGRDAAGDWWVSWALRKGAWKAVEEEVSGLGGKKGR